jgi:hypothetical protein
VWKGRLTQHVFVKGVIINKTTTCFGYCASPSSGCYIAY